MAITDEILARLNAFAAQLAQQVAPIGVILANVLITTKETQPFDVQDRVIAIQADVVDALTVLDSPIFGNAELRALMIANQTALLTAIGTPAQVGIPVDASATAALFLADSVWNTVPTSFVRIMGDALVLTAQMQAGEYTFNSPVTVGHFHVNNVNFASNDYYLPAFAYANWDDTNVLVTDTLLSMLTRQNPGASVAYGWPPQTQVLVSPAGFPNVEWITDFDEAEFAEWKSQKLGLGPSMSAPVWPGIANVTTLAPVAIDVTVTITEAMEGVIVTITGVPSKQGQFVLGDLISWRNVGAIAFTDDNGQAEYPQLLGLQNAVYCPKAMAHAGGVVVRASPGVTGTITPFTIP